MATRTLELPVSWKRRLVHLRVMCGTKAAPELDAGEVARVEKALGVRLGDQLLGILATGGSLLQEYEVRLAMLPGHTEYAHKAGISRGLIGIGKRADGETLLCASALGTMIHRFDVKTGTTKGVPGEQWLDDLIQEQQTRLRSAKDTTRARGAKSIPQSEVDAFAPAVVTNESCERVHHPKFGDGEVSQDLGDGKVEVSFASGDVKVLLRSFLQPAE